MPGHPVRPRRWTPADAVVGLARLTRMFDGLAAISRVNLEVTQGEIVWLRGSNGSGKTTLLRVIATAISPTFGNGTVLGHDLITERAAIRAHVDLLGHQNRLYDELTAAENLQFACHLYHVATRRAGVGSIVATLDRVGLHKVAAVRVGHFSQGMRQRLALARCMIRAPQLILLDEPYAGLDDDARAVVGDLLAEAKRAGQTVVLASHETPPLDLVDRQLAMDSGRLVTPLRVAL